MIAREFREGEIVLDKLRVVRKLGAGGMGVVYKVQHTYFDRKFFVLKTLNPDLGPNADVSRRMHREAQVLGNISHPNVVEVLDAGVLESGAPYFVMEYLEGTTLDEVLKRAPRGIGILSALGVGIEMCDALDVIHTRHGIIHRDLKPANIFLERLPDDGTRGLSVAGLRARTKLLDFGVVHLMSGGIRPTGKMFIGTYRYSAPEQLRAKQVTPQTDLYAVGLVLFEMLTGRHVFAEARGSRAMGEAHMTRSPPHVSQHVDLPPDLAHLVMSCLEKTPSARPVSALGLAEELRAVLSRFRASPAVADGNRTEPAGVEMVLDMACEVDAQGPTVHARDATPESRSGESTRVDARRYNEEIARTTAQAAALSDARPTIERMPRSYAGTDPTNTQHRLYLTPKPRADTKPITVPIPRLLAPATRWRPSEDEALLAKVYVDVDGRSPSARAERFTESRPAAGSPPVALLRHLDAASTGPIVRPAWDETTTRIGKGRRRAVNTRAARGLLTFAGGVVLAGAVTIGIVIRRAGPSAVRATVAGPSFSSARVTPPHDDVGSPSATRAVEPLPAEVTPLASLSSGAASSAPRVGKPMASSHFLYRVDDGAAARH